MDIAPETIELQRGQALFLHPLAVYATHGNWSFDHSHFPVLFDRTCRWRCLRSRRDLDEVSSTFERLSPSFLLIPSIENPCVSPASCLN